MGEVQCAECERLEREWRISDEAIVHVSSKKYRKGVDDPATELTKAEQLRDAALRRLTQHKETHKKAEK